MCIIKYAKYLQTLRETFVGVEASNRTEKEHYACEIVRDRFHFSSTQRALITWNRVYVCVLLMRFDFIICIEYNLNYTAN